VRDSGRDRGSLEVTMFGLGEDTDKLKRYADLGVARVVAGLPAEKSDKVLPIIDKWANMIRLVNG
jgi:hypothetical protein